MTPGLVNSGQRKVRVSVFVKYYSRWDPSQGPSDRKFNGYQIGAFPEIRLTAPSPAPTSDQVDPLRTSDSPAERSACRCTSPPALSH
ncbi:hypothetical protein N7447_011001 [Penicillium robsamsonii]|uniref:uncharacterized protein n=1 Tax=Penicillium robsamsonii TaxID=1792511 RepID=UPI002547A472|nr:uncharacterized protein N7447_011001 [Penicillium robsamsonii]KAJ5807545.1 hypothetical protein N7447_011001 [Penicillium robsamsonii]